jgi:proline iminopeptidase
MRLRTVVGAGAALAGYGGLVRPRIADMAVTLPAPPETVWPWLVQMGADRAGFYSFDRLDNGGRPSAREIHPEWQELAVGDHVASVPDGSRWFVVDELAPERRLGLRATLRLPAATCFDPGAQTPRWYLDSRWRFDLAPEPRGRTRLRVTSSGSGRPRALVALANRVFWEPAHLVMQARQFAGLRRRVARQAFLNAA